MAGRAAALSRSSGKIRLMVVWNVDLPITPAIPQAGYAIVRPAAAVRLLDSRRSYAVTIGLEAAIIPVGGVRSYLAKTNLVSPGRRA